MIGLTILIRSAPYLGMIRIARDNVIFKAAFGSFKWHFFLLNGSAEPLREICVQRVVLCFP